MQLECEKIKTGIEKIYFTSKQLSRHLCLIKLIFSYNTYLSYIVANLYLRCISIIVS